MRILILFVILTLNVIPAYSQTDTIYYNKEWKKCIKDTASYYRFATKLDSSLYHLEDYYMTGQIQMKGNSIGLETHNMVGEVFYYDSAGYIEAISNYSDENKIFQKLFFKHSDKIEATFHFENKLRNGEAVLNYINGSKRCEGEYLNGEPVGKWTFYHENGNLFTTIKFKNGKWKNEAKFYNKNGKIDLLLNSVTITGYANDGTEYFFYKQLNSRATPTVDLANYLNKNVNRNGLPVIPEEYRLLTILKIDEEGNVCDVFVFDLEYEELAAKIRTALYNSPKWNVANLNSKPIACYYFLSLRYSNGKFIYL